MEAQQKLSEEEIIKSAETAELLVAGRSKLYGLKQFARLKDSWATELERLNAEMMEMKKTNR